MGDWGDFNHDGKVDGLDYALFEEMNGSAPSGGGGYKKPGKSGVAGLGVCGTFLLMIIVVSIIGCFNEFLAVLVLLCFLPFIF